MISRDFPRIPPPQTFPGKEYGKFARYDNEGRELVYVGIEDMVMHRDVIEKIDREWDKLFK